MTTACPTQTIDNIYIHIYLHSACLVVKFISSQVAYTLHNNTFDGIGKDTCHLSVFNGGEMVEFTTDCDICDCYDLCHRCREDEVVEVVEGKGKE